MAERVEVTTGEFTWRGCFIILMFFTNNLIWGGVYKGMGVLLPTLRDQFTTRTWVIGIVVSMMGCGSTVSGLLARPLDNKFGSRRSLIACTLALSCGLMLVSLATNPIYVAIPLTVLVGPPYGITMVIICVLLGRHFTKHFTLACGIGHAGGAVSLLIFAPMTQLFLDTYGWRGAMLLIAAICCHSIPCAALIRDNKPEYDSVPDRDANEQRDNGRTVSVKAFFVDLYKKADVGMLLEFKYWIVSCSRFGVSFSNSSWLIYYVPHLEAKGFSPQVAAALCSAAAVGYLFGTFIWAPFIDRGHIRCSTGIIISSLMLSLTFVVDPWVNNIVSYVFTTFMCGLFISAMYTLNDVLTKELFGIDRLANAFAWLRAFLILSLLLGGFVSGWLYDATGSYDLAFIIVGCVPTVTLLPLVIGLILKRV